MKTVTLKEYQDALRGQGVSSREHMAVVCPVCSTPQSIASLKLAGASQDGAESYIGFSCEGRLTKAGPWPSIDDLSKKAAVRRETRGCDWTLGGLFKLHKIEVMQEGKAHPTFAAATPEVAQKLEVWVFQKKASQE